MNTGSDVCGAVSAEEASMFYGCTLNVGHDGPHVGAAGADREAHQFTHVMGERAPSESEQTMLGWSQLLPPIGSTVRVFGVDGRYYYGGNPCTLDAIAFGDDEPTAIRLRSGDKFAVTPWRRVDAIEWVVEQ